MKRLRRFRKHRSHRDGMPGKTIYLLPNLCTTVSLFFGFLSIVKSLNGSFVTAAWMILVSGIFDMLDGRIARLTNTGSRFGVEYDSLTDLSAFGLAPGILMYTWQLRSFGKLGWLVAFLYFACGALRLARFNVQHGTVEFKYFQGLPIPVAAYSVATYIIFYHHYHFLGIPQTRIVALLITLAAAMLMVSSVHYWSGKVLRLSRVDSFFVLLVIIVSLFFVGLHPETMLFFLVVGYVLSGFVYEIFHHWPVNVVYKKIRKPSDGQLKNDTSLIE